ncbi:MAG TPA: efflux RND transporter periplasmic adaptor subunit [Mucilaginibacter sp.]|jgi:membrane fusion protein (multidrug efflux system)|nr:efflux RND transporter periplasmic adaptor subunit [Mucilaginibacter sp.]
MKIFLIPSNSHNKLIQLAKAITLLTPIVCSFLLYSCTGPVNANNKGNLALKLYATFRLSPRTITINTDYPTSIQGLQEIEIRSKVDGFVEKIYVDEGLSVKKGQVLFKIAAPQYEQELNAAKAQVNTAEAEVNAARLVVDKVKPLVERDIISPYELESARYALQTKTAALEQARALLANAKTNLGYTIITSPADGVIGSLPYKIGSLVNNTNTSPLTSVYNTSTIYAYFSINEKRLLAISKDSIASGINLRSKLANIPFVSLILSDGSIYSYKGKVETVNGSVNSSTGSANVRAAFANPKGLLRSGNSATIRIPAIAKSVLLVPQSATYELQDKRIVYLLDHHNKIKSTPIKVSDSIVGQFFIVEDGLHAGDKIVLEGMGTIKDGSEIKPLEVNEDSLYRSLK